MDVDVNPYVPPPISSVFDVHETRLEDRKERDVHGQINHHESRKTFIKSVISRNKDSINRMITKPEKEQIQDDSKFRETHQEYVARMKQAFLMQYAIQTKKEEIDRFGELTRLKREKVDMTEECLNQDAAIFDEVLKQEDHNLIEAMTAAEKEAKRRAILVNELRSRTAEESRLNAEINRLEQKVAELKSYKSFLEKLMPEKVRNQRTQAREYRRLERERNKAAARADRIGRLSLANERIGQRRKTFFKIHRRSSIRPSFTSGPSTPKLNQETEDEKSSSSEESDSELYFTSIEQVLDLFNELGEDNIRVLQNYQEMQEEQDELWNMAGSVKQRLENELSVPLKHLHLLKDQVDHEEANQSDYTKLDLIVFAGLTAAEQDTIMQELHTHVCEVYQRCLRKENTTLNTIQSIKNLEGKMIEGIQNLQSLPRDKVQLALEANVKAHRIEMKQSRLAHRRKQQEDRIRATLERAQGGSRKLVERKVVERSKPPIIRRDDVAKGKTLDEEQEETLFLFG